MRRSTPCLPAWFSPVVNSERKAVARALLALLVGGAVLNGLERGRRPEAAGGPRAPAAGLRALVADWLWLQADLAWEQRDAGRTRYLLGLTVAAEPESAYFWLNGARMLAYDLPAWCDEAERVGGPALRAHRRKQAAVEALRWLERGLHWRPESAAIRVEMGNICLYALGDVARAADCYRLAAAQPDAPAYVRRIHRRLQARERGAEITENTIEHKSPPSERRAGIQTMDGPNP